MRLLARGPFRTVSGMRHNNSNTAAGSSGLSKKYKVYGSVLGVAVAALAIDQILPGPAAATASTPALTATAAVLPALITKVQENGASSDRIALSTSLATLADEAHTPACVNTLFRSLDAEVVEVEVSDVALEDSPPEVPELAVASVLVASGTAVATINGEPAQVGTRVQGWRVAAITRETVTLSHGLHTVELPVQALTTN